MHLNGSMTLCVENIRRTATTCPCVALVIRREDGTGRMWERHDSLRSTDPDVPFDDTRNEHVAPLQLKKQALLSNALFNYCVHGASASSAA